MIARDTQVTLETWPARQPAIISLLDIAERGRRRREITLHFATILYLPTLRVFVFFARTPTLNERLDQRVVIALSDSSTALFGVGAFSFVVPLCTCRVLFL